VCARVSLRQKAGLHIKRFVSAPRTLERPGGATPHRPLIGSHRFGLAKSDAFNFHHTVDSGLMLLRQPRITALSITLGAAAAAAADWPQFRGPQACGVDASQPLPVEWSVKTGRNVRWQTPVPGLAHASPIVSGDRIYVATAVGPGDEELKVGLYGEIEPVEESGVHQWCLLALARDSGKVIWNGVGHPAVPRVKRHPKSTHCNPTPATDGRHIVTIFGSEGLFCFDTAGNRVWRNDLGPLDSGYYEVPSAQWGFASSPVIHDGKVIVLCDVLTNSFLAAFDLASGKEIWRTPRRDVPTWGCPTVVEAGARRQVVVNGWHHSGGYDFASGRELWRLDGGGDIPVPTPVFANGLIFLTSAHGNLRPMRAIRPEAAGDITPSDPAGTNAAIAWVHPRRGDYMQTPIVVSNRVYGCTDGGLLTCFDATDGKVVYSERLGGPAQGFTASPVSDGRKLYFPGETGKVLVVPVGDRFSVVATNDLDDLCMATPAISEGTLYFRTRSRLIAVGRN
jgi:outer membrane protein assembly factor BamB